jgi:hypothetical protein
VWRWAMRAVASAVLWTAVVQLASIAGLWRPRGLADCWGGGGSGGAVAGLAALAGEDRATARLSPLAPVPRSKCSLLLPLAPKLLVPFVVVSLRDLRELVVLGFGRSASQHALKWRF